MSDTDNIILPKVNSVSDQEFIKQIALKQPEWMAALSECVASRNMLQLYWLLAEINTFHSIFGRQPPSGTTLQTEILVGIRDLAKSAGANPVLAAIRKMNVGK